jgi:hypothetical protein
LKLRKSLIFGVGCRVDFHPRLLLMNVMAPKFLMTCLLFALQNRSNAMNSVLSSISRPWELGAAEKRLTNAELHQGY